MKTIMKKDLPSAKSSALRRPQRGADTCDYGLQQVILHGDIVGHVTTSWAAAIQDNVALWVIKAVVGKGRGIVAICMFPKEHLLRCMVEKFFIQTRYKKVVDLMYGK